MLDSYKPMTVYGHLKIVEGNIKYLSTFKICKNVPC